MIQRLQNGYGINQCTYLFNNGNPSTTSTAFSAVLLWIKEMQCIQHSKTCSIYSWVVKFCCCYCNFFYCSLYSRDRSIHLLLQQPLKTFHALLNCNAYLMTRKHRLHTRQKSHKKFHSTLRAKRATFTFWVLKIRIYFLDPWIFL